MLLRQDLRLRQEQVLQPQQILRSELIQLPQLLLEARFQQEFEQNPLLEEVEELEYQEQQENENTLESQEVKEAAESADDAEEKKAEKDEAEVDWEALLNDEDDQRVYKSNQAITEPVEIPQADIRTLADMLMEQLHMDFLNDEQMVIGEFIIGSLDSRGYLVDPDGRRDVVDHIALLTESSEEDVLEVLRKIQRFDPAGIASRDLCECLMVQLEVEDRQETLEYLILHDHYDNFVNRRYEIIASATGAALADIQEAFDLIGKLNPRPGEGQIDERLNYIIPDLLVEEISGELIVALNDGNIPSFQINEELKRLILSRDSDKEARKFAIHKAENARWFINAIIQRRTTMMRTMTAIVERQTSWFQTGKEVDLKPMILNDIAEMINMDISTISRVTREKYVQTPYGVFELKYFFNDRMETGSGEEVATRIIKSKLKEIIEAEDKKKPLSDQAIADLLKIEGYPIARRTVQKYREQLSIAVRRLRRVVT